jgi:hypothetical protein
MTEIIGAIIRVPHLLDSITPGGGTALTPEDETNSTSEGQRLLSVEMKIAQTTFAP